MCGIAGIVSPNGFALDELRKMTDIICHRGPDDEGFVVFKQITSSPLCLGGATTNTELASTNLRYRPIQRITNCEKDQFVIGLGHRRLSVLDLSPYGHQPMCSAEGRLWITYNGEIFNYLEIKNELIQLGHQFISSSDTEVILNAYKHWGIDCLNKFVGMWSFAIYDCNTQEIFLSRDRYGIKPLYYWFSPNGDFYFGSEIKQFTVTKGWSAKLNSQRAHDYLIYASTDHTDETMFSGVYHVPGGHYLKSRVSEISVNGRKRLKPSPWYKINCTPYRGSFTEASEKFEEYFKDAVKLHLRSDVPIGTALSGGLDSSAIVCEINNILKQEKKEHVQKTFSSCSEDERYDERKWMDIVVNYTKVDAHFIYPDFENLFELTPKILWHQDEPYQSQSAFLGYQVFELARKNNVKVLINGQGADEYLGGYGQFRIARYANLVKVFHWITLYRQIKSTEKFSMTKRLMTFGKILNHFFPEMLRDTAIKRFGQISGIRGLIDIDRLGAKDEHPNRHIPIKYGTAEEISRHMTFHSSLPKLLRWEDRNSMAHSIEARVPFLDHRLVEFAQSLPVQYHDDDEYTKKVMRTGLKKILPFEICNRKDKKGFITPEERWVKEDHTNIFRSKVKQSILQLDGILKPEVLAYFDDMVIGNVPFDYFYWRLILFAEWVKQFKIDITDK